MVEPAQTPPDRQPASPVDLDAYPAASATCLSIRHDLRDYADGELAAARRAAVEAHVHTCRTCALALARTESELMGITQAMQELDLGRAGPSAGFTAAVMEGVRELDEVRPPVGFTQRVMARVREEVLLSEVRQLGQRRWWQLAGLVAAAVLAGVALWWESGPGTAVVEVREASAASLYRGGRELPAGVGDRLAAGDELRTAAAGRFVLDWRLGSGGLDLRVGEDSRLRLPSLRPPRVELAVGELQLELREDLAVVVDDGSVLEIAPGRHVLLVARVRHQDGRAGLRTRLQVETGAARIVRGGRRTAVAAGQTASYTSFAAVHITSTPDRGVFLASRERGAETPAKTTAAASAAQPTYARILDPWTASPVPAATVRVRTSLGLQTLTADAQGRFLLPRRSSGQSGQFAVLEAVPPPSVPGLGAMLAQPVFLDEAFAERRFFLGRARTLGGRLHAADSRRLVDAWIQACLVDELFGCARPLTERVAVGAAGVFAITGLPAQLSPHQGLVLLAGAAGLQPRVVAASSRPRHEDRALDLKLQPLPRRSVRKLAGRSWPANGALRVLAPVRGLPTGTAYWLVSLRTDGAGRVDLPAGELLYLVDGPNSARRIVTDSGEVALVPDVAMSKRLVSHGELLDEPGLYWLETRMPLDSIAQVPAAGGKLSVHEERTGQACPGSLLFARSPTGALRFVGVYDGRRALNCRVETAGTLYALSPEGLVGRIELDRQLGRRQVSIPVQRNCVVRWTGATDAGPVRLWRVRDGVPVLRDPADTEWTLLPGEYRLRDRELVLRAGARQDLTR